MGPTHETTEDLIVRYQASTDMCERNHLKNEIYLQNTGSCHYVANKFRNSLFDYDDLVGFTHIGFTKAIEAYDSTKQVKFISFVIRVMENEILMAIRKEKKNIGLLYLQDAVSNNSDEGDVLTFMDTLIDESTLENSGIDSKLFVQALVEEARHILKPNEYITFLNIISEEPLTQRELACQMNMTQTGVSRYVGRIQRKLTRFVKSKDFYLTYGYTTLMEAQ